MTDHCLEITRTGRNKDQEQSGISYSLTVGGQFYLRIIVFLPVFIAGGTVNPDEGAQQAANFRGLMFNACFVTVEDF